MLSTSTAIVSVIGLYEAVFFFFFFFFFLYITQDLRSSQIKSVLITPPIKNVLRVEALLMSTNNAEDLLRRSIW